MIDKREPEQASTLADEILGQKRGREEWKYGERNGSRDGQNETGRGDRE